MNLRELVFEFFQENQTRDDHRHATYSISDPRAISRSVRPSWIHCNHANRRKVEKRYSVCITGRTRQGTYQACRLAKILPMATTLTLRQARPSFFNFDWNVHKVNIRVPTQPFRCGRPTAPLHPDGSFPLSKITVTLTISGTTARRWSRQSRTNSTWRIRVWPCGRDWGRNPCRRCRGPGCRG